MNWKTVELNINDIIPHNDNPRYITHKQEKQLKKSIDKFGLCQPIVINTDNTIIGGHQRYFIMKQSGHQMITCIQPDHKLDDNELYELMIRLNKNTGEWNYDILANIMSDDKLIDLGFTENELELDSLKPQTKKITIKLIIPNIELLESAVKHIKQFTEKNNDTYFKVSS